MLKFGLDVCISHSSEGDGNLGPHFPIPSWQAVRDGPFPEDVGHDLGHRGRCSSGPPQASTTPEVAGHLQSYSLCFVSKEGQVATATTTGKLLEVEQWRPAMCF